MEKKRKLPSRAAARVEHVSKKRTLTPPENRPVTPAIDEPPAPAAPQPLPKSIQAGKPLPTVEEPQPDDLPAREYQSVQERQAEAPNGVLAESLHRSRQRWISEGLFEKYWSKPSKRKGIVIEEPNNPAKDTMTKLGQVTITIEPHIFEATMFAVKDPKPPAPPPTAPRPIIQYGPPHGTMPPITAPTTPSQIPAKTPSQTPSLGPVETQQLVPKQEPQLPPSSTLPEPSPQPIASPRGLESVLSSATTATQPASKPVAIPAAALITSSQPPPATAPVASGSAPSPSAARPPSALPNVAAPRPMPAAPPRQPSAIDRPMTGNSVQTPARPTAVAPSPPPGATRSASGHPPGTDPIIVTLAEKATEDPHLRDLMKRVANGNAPKDELERFQSIIDQITQESRRKGVGQGPSADRLLVDGRTVRYFAEEVRAILDIVFTSNPKQTSADLRPPAGSDPLVVELVKACLDRPEVKDMVRRIAENRPQFSDATDLKMVLDRLKNKIAREQDRLRTQSPSVPPPTATPRPTTSATSSPAIVQQPHAPQLPPQQALRSKGPPPQAKQDIASIVFDFAGGTGDRYLFPKFSILEYLPPPQVQGHPQWHEVVASFLIVRKGSTSEYGGDPDLDYYQPVTIRLFAPSHRHLESLARVVAPQDEVRRYMDDVMNNMTRAEYVLLAMRLPRKEKEEKESSMEKDTNGANGMTANGGELQIREVQPMQGVLWTAKATSTPPQQKPLKKVLDEDQQYQNFITSITPREAEEV